MFDRNFDCGVVEWPSEGKLPSPTVVGEGLGEGVAEREGASITRMKRELSFVVFEEDGAFVARCLDVDVASEADTKDEAIASLREALELHFENSPISLDTLPTRKYQFGQVAIGA